MEADLLEPADREAGSDPDTTTNPKPEIQPPADDDNSDDARLRRLIIKLESQPKRTPDEILAELQQAYQDYILARVAPYQAQIELVKAEQAGNADDSHRDKVQAALEAEPAARERLLDAMLFAIDATSGTRQDVSYEMIAKLRSAIDTAKAYLDQQAAGPERPAGQGGIGPQ